jgi:UBX domain-containing protein 1
MADGSRLIARLNHTHTLADLRTYISTARPEYASVPFALLNTFPPSELTEENKTLKVG